jgi:endo-1,4-beta-xylanase
MAVGGDTWESDYLFSSTQRQTVISTHFNSIVAGNIMKMSYLEPTQNSFSWTKADALVGYVDANPGMVLHGHALIWHAPYQVPSFITNFAGTPVEFDAALMNHVTKVAQHFAGKVVSWDVVNEAINDNGTAGWRTKLDDGSDSPLYSKSGNSAVYIEHAFTAARAADPGAKLYYNDYNTEWATSKQNFMLAMVDDFKNRNIPIDGIGFQMHVRLDFPSINTIKAAFQAVVNKGLLVRISELDVAVNASNALTALDPTTSALQKQRYHDIVKAYLDTVPLAQRGGITIWGLLDGQSWIISNGHPDWPLLFNNDFSTKPAFDGVAEALQGL